MYISAMLRESAPIFATRLAGDGAAFIAAAEEIEELKSQLDRKPPCSIEASSSTSGLYRAGRMGMGDSHAEAPAR